MAWDMQWKHGYDYGMGQTWYAEMCMSAHVQSLPYGRASTRMTSGHGECMYDMRYWNKYIMYDLARWARKEIRWALA